MDFIRRAWLFTKAKISRTILLIIAFSAILVFVLAGLIINSAANQSIATAEKNAGAVVTLGVSPTYMRSQFQNNSDSTSSSSSTSTSSSSSTTKTFTMPTVSGTTAQKIVTNLSNYIKSYSFYLTNVSADASSGITKVSETSGSSSAQGGFGGGGFAGRGESSGDFSITGVNALSDYSSFTASYKIESGRGITSSDSKKNSDGSYNVVIESTLASNNSLKVGSTFVIKNSSTTYKMKVIGIFEPQSSSTSNGSISYMNTLYTSLTFANTINGTSGKLSGASFNMENPANATTFVSKANKIVDSSTYTVAKDDSTYLEVKSSMSNVAGFAKNIVILVAIAGAIILALIVMLMIRERRYEIGVLMSLGETKVKIVAQFFAELFMVMIVSVVIAVAAGNVVGNIVGQQLLNQETSTTTTTAGMPSQGGGTDSSHSFGKAGGGFAGTARSAFGIGRSSTEAKALEKLNIKMSASQIAILVAIAVLITLVAVALASLGILRLNPKEVLTN